MAHPLSERHRAQQLVLRAATIRDLTRLWPALDWARLDATFPAFAVAVSGLVRERRRMSVALSVRYLEAFRYAEGIPGTLRPLLPGDVDERRFTTSLRVVSVAAGKAATGRGVPAEQARRTSFVRVSGVVSRHVLDGGRQAVMGTLAREESRPRYARVTDGAPCAFCALIASRGAVYLSEGSAGFDAHDDCGCVPEPVYDPARYELPDRAREWDELYRSSAAGRSGKDALRAFAAAYRAQ